MTRHPDLEWEFVEARLSEDKEALEVLRLMEESGGEPDTIGIDEKSGKLIFCDCSSESPAGRRSLCYDDEALQKRKKNPPKGSAIHQAQEMGVSLLTEELYRRLQELGPFDLKTSSWIATPDEIRSKGGALFCEREEPCSASADMTLCLHFTMAQIHTILCVDGEVISLYDKLVVH